MGTKSIPGFSGELSTAWDTSAGGQSTLVPTASNADLEVHMGEAPMRGERDDEE